MPIDFLFREYSNGIGNKHPQAPRKMIIVAIAEIIVFRGAKGLCCGNRTAANRYER